MKAHRNFSLDDLKSFSLVNAREINGLIFFILGNSGEYKKVLSVQRYKSLRPDPNATAPEAVKDLIEALDVIAYNKGYGGIIDYSNSLSE